MCDDDLDDEQWESDGEFDDEQVEQIELFVRQAFTEAELAPFLQEMKGWGIMPGLVDCYIEAVEKNPSRGKALASALARLDPLTIDIRGTLDSRVDFDAHYGEVDFPKKKFLFHSVLSGLSLKHRLTQNSVIYTAIEEGFNPHSSGLSRFKQQSPEVLVVGACIQLLLAGSMIPTKAAGYYKTSAEVVANNLKAQKAAGTVTNPQEIRVLELAISHAETGLKPENDLDDVWIPLFPSKS